MNLDEFKNAWQKQEEKLDDVISINQRLLAKIELNQPKNILSKIRIYRSIEAFVFLIIIISLWQFIVANLTLSAATISASVLNVFAILGLIGNIGQIVFISQLDYSAPIKEVQKSLFDISTHKLQMTKLLLLSIPFYMAYVFLGFDVLFNIDLLEYLTVNMRAFYLISSLLMFVPLIWLLKKLSYKNINISWVNKVVTIIIGKELVSAADFLNEIEK